jgi:hypothetical protein
MIDLCVFGGVSNVWPFFLKQFHTFYADSYASLTVSPCCAEVLQGKEWANVSLPLPSPVPRFGLPLLGLGIELGPHAMWSGDSPDQRVISPWSPKKLTKLNRFIISNNHPVFTGEKDSVPLNEFLDRFKSLARADDLSDDKRAGKLLACCSRGAFSVLRKVITDGISQQQRMALYENDQQHLTQRIFSSVKTEYFTRSIVPLDTAWEISSYP